MPIYLIFDNGLSKYLCVNENGKHIPFEYVGNSRVDFLSKQMKCFGDLRIEAFLHRGESVILKNEQNQFCCSNNGNIPFMLDQLMDETSPKYNGEIFAVPVIKKNKVGLNSVTEFKNYQLSTGELPRFTGIQLTDPMVQMFKVRLGIKYWIDIEQHRNDTAEDMTRDMVNNSKIDVSKLNKNTRIAICKHIQSRNTDIVNQQESKIDVLDRVQPEGSKRFTVAFSPIVKNEQSQPELSYGNDQGSFKYLEPFEEDSSRQSVDVSALMAKYMIDQHDQPKIKSIIVKCEIQFEKLDEMAKKIVSKK